MKKEALSQGVIVPIVTPYHFSELPILIDHVLKGGVQMIFLLGTTGEAPYLQLKQKKELVKLAASHIGKKAQLLVGITCPTIPDTLELMELANEVGAFASVLAPRVIGPDCAAITEKVLTSSSGPLLLYNNPEISEGQSIPLDEITPFFSEERVLGIKDSSGDFAYFDEFLRKRPSKRFKVYFGPENNLADALKKEIDGFVPGTGNLEPRLACDLWLKKEKGPWTEWNAIKETLKEKVPNDYIASLKLLLQERGLITDARRFDKNFKDL